MYKLNILAEYKIMDRYKKNTDIFGLSTEGELIETFFEDNYNPTYKKLIFKLSDVLSISEGEIDSHNKTIRILLKITANYNYFLIITIEEYEKLINALENGNS